MLPVGFKQVCWKPTWNNLFYFNRLVENQIETTCSISTDLFKTNLFYFNRLVENRYETTCSISTDLLKTNLFHFNRLAENQLVPFQQTLLAPRTCPTSVPGLNCPNLVRAKMVRPNRTHALWREFTMIVSIVLLLLFF